MQCLGSGSKGQSNEVMVPVQTSDKTNIRLSINQKPKSEMLKKRQIIKNFHISEWFIKF